MKKMSKKKRKKLNEEKYKRDQKMNNILSEYENAVEEKKKQTRFVCFHNVTVNGIEIPTKNHKTGICEICGCTDTYPIYVSAGKTEKINRKELLNFSKESLEKYILYEVKKLSKSNKNYNNLEVKYQEHLNNEARRFFCFTKGCLPEKLLSFSEILQNMINEKYLKNPDVYKAANIDAKLFSKIINDKSYHPGKSTVLAFAVAMKLDLFETEQFLMEAGYAFSPNILSDVIVKYYIETKHYDIDDINATLFEYNQKLLGSSVRK